MVDILADYREWRSQQEGRIGTHADDCHMWPRHERCMIRRLAEEVERLRNSAVESREMVQLTDEEREAVRFFSLIDGPGNVPVANKRAATLRALLKRTGGCTPQLDCGADRTSVASTLCRGTGG